MKGLILILGAICLLFCISMVSAERMPVPGGDDGVWSTVLNDFLNVSHNDSGELENDTVSSLQILNNTIVDADISDITNLTLGEKITFTPGDIFITGSGSLNLNAKMGFSASSWEIYMAEGCQLAINSGGSIENV